MRNIDDIITKVLKESTFDRLENIYYNHRKNYQLLLPDSDYTDEEMTNGEGNDVDIADAVSTLLNFFKQYTTHGNKQAAQFINQLMTMKDFIIRKSKQQDNLSNEYNKQYDEAENRVNQYTREVFGVDTPFDLPYHDYDEYEKNIQKIQDHFKNDPIALSYLKS